MIRGAKFLAWPFVSLVLRVQDIDKDNDGDIVLAVKPMGLVFFVQ